MIHGRLLEMPVRSKARDAAEGQYHGDATPKVNSPMSSAVL